MLTFSEVCDRLRDINDHPYVRYKTLRTYGREDTPEEAEIRASGVDLIDQFLQEITPSEPTSEEIEQSRKEVEFEMQGGLPVGVPDRHGEAYLSHLEEIYNSGNNLTKAVIAARAAVIFYQIPVSVHIKSWPQFVETIKAVVVDT